MNEPVFLDLLQIIQVHQDQIQRYGGSEGLRDLNLLQSALAMPCAGFGGEYAHTTVFEMAAAYLYHLVKNHPFVDGNKRVGAASALVFLRMNGWSTPCSDDELVSLTLGVISGEWSKTQVAVFFKERAQPI